MTERLNPNQPRFFMAEDDDGHWYVIPVENRSEWDEWLNLFAEDENQSKWIVPDFARAIDNPDFLTFTDPK